MRTRVRTRSVVFLPLNRIVLCYCIVKRLVDFNSSEILIPEYGKQIYPGTNTVQYRTGPGTQNSVYRYRVLLCTRASTRTVKCYKLKCIN